MSNHQIIAALKAALESEREKDAEQFYKQSKFAPTEWAVMNFKSGHEAATERLMDVVEKAVEMAEFYSTGQHYATKDYDVIDLGKFEDHVVGKKAREFLTKLADAGEIKKPGHYTIDAESFDKLLEDLQSDKEPSEQVKKAREKFLQIKKESGDGK